MIEVRHKHTKKVHSKFNCWRSAICWITEQENDYEFETYFKGKLCNSNPFI